MLIWPSWRTAGNCNSNWTHPLPGWFWWFLSSTWFMWCVSGQNWINGVWGWFIYWIKVWRWTRRRRKEKYLGNQLKEITWKATFISIHNHHYLLCTIMIMTTIVRWCWLPRRCLIIALHCQLLQARLLCQNNFATLRIIYYQTEDMIWYDEDDDDQIADYLS